jgi:hypothetical protein
MDHEDHYWVLLTSTIVNFIILIFVSALIIYHFWIKRQGVSTYEHIMYKREQLEMKKELKSGGITLV